MLNAIKEQRVLWGGYAGLLALTIAAIFYFSGGVFAYCLDDTYIYLALAENLPFNYSLNAPGLEAGAPASSILYPYLLMPLAHTPLALITPLLINIMAGALVLALLLRLERQINLIPTAIATARQLMTLGFGVLLNMGVLIFCGMEHTLHLACALAIFTVLLDLAENRSAAVPRWFWLALFIGPLLRYEALALTLLAGLYMMHQGGRRLWLPALLSITVSVAMVVAFSFYLHQLGYGWLPSSVLSKSAPMTIANDDGLSVLALVGGLLFNLLESITRPTSWGHILEMVVLMGLLARPSLPAGQRKLGFVVLLAALAHLLLGKFGWFGRYHAYILALLLLTILYLARPLWRAMLARAWAVPVFVLLLLGATSASLWYSVQVPAAAGQIYRTHGLSHRFIAEYWQDDVAAYDVGYISWRNPHNVVDLFGLASERIRRIIRTPLAKELIPMLLQSEQIDLIIAQDTLPNYYWRPEWQDFASLDLDGRHVVTTLHTHFYLTNPARADELREKLQKFAATLPSDVHLHFIR